MLPDAEQRTPERHLALEVGAVHHDRGHPDRHTSPRSLASAPRATAPLSPLGSGVSTPSIAATLLAVRAGVRYSDARLERPRRLVWYRRPAVAHPGMSGLSLKHEGECHISGWKGGSWDMGPQGGDRTATISGQEIVVRGDIVLTMAGIAIKSDS
jgi:hypothetical protein